MPSLNNAIVEEDLASIVSASLPWDSFSGTTVLITGAAGFLPAYMVETLLYLNRSHLARPARVIAIVRNLDRARERFRHHLDDPNLQILVQNISDPLTFREPFDFAIHAASQASPVFYRTDPVGTLSANVLGIWHLLEAARQHPVRGFLYFSSGEVYGIIKSNSGPIAEDDGGFLDPTDVRSCYGESKRMAETMCVAWAHQYGIPTRIVRPFHTYGPGMRLDDGRVFADFVRDILKGGPIVLQSDGSARRSFCYLADATLGFFTVLLLGKNGEAYNVANPNGECSIAELVDCLVAEFHSEGITVERRARTDQNYFVSPIVSTVPNIDKAKALGWNPAHSIEQGFRRTVESYR
ncbi:nucleoside-diphosphate-sugar epimerase [Edaphobacter aggregans]|uniref:Nucleoside-diphosphate-sugar epimerase n=1 Tax=Edaphobacter aggregans TaxID=570835 RepID=A0A3R9NWN7_9BACT|nr:NAD-dependent epimerase/dehydratase family protein [Edaphobacter aggregans]RSL16393.1 nucleoside-diphosphate-sugar epimerase [Edaphobacter aggregans]